MAECARCGIEESKHGDFYHPFAPAVASERCACGHDLHEPGQCGDKRLTFDCGCSYSPDTQPAPREAGAMRTREEFEDLVGWNCPLTDREEKMLLAHDAALRAEAKSIHDERDRLWLELLSEKARADAAEREQETLRQMGMADAARAAAAEAERDRLAEALREIAEDAAYPCGCKRIAAAALKREEGK